MLNDFSTHDIALAVTLAIHGYKIVDCGPRPERPDKATFTFAGVDRDVLNDYDMDKLSVEPKLFMLRYRSLTGMANRACKRA